MQLLRSVWRAYWYEEACGVTRSQRDTRDFLSGDIDCKMSQ